MQGRSCVWFLGVALLEVCKDAGAITLANQLGRLDFASLLLASVSTILVLGGIFSYFNFRSIAKAQAAEEAQKIAENTAERVTNEYLQRELPDLLSVYRSMLDSDGLSDQQANRMADAQENPSRS